MPSEHFDGMGETVLGIFGEEIDAIFKPQSGNPQSIEVIFNARFQEVDRDDKPYGAEKPIAWFRTGIICPITGDIIEIDGTDYLIRVSEPDGLELSKLVITDIV